MKRKGVSSLKRKSFQECLNDSVPLTSDWFPLRVQAVPYWAGRRCLLLLAPGTWRGARLAAPRHHPQRQTFSNIQVDLANTYNIKLYHLATGFQSWRAQTKIWMLLPVSWAWALNVRTPWWGYQWSRSSILRVTPRPPRLRLSRSPPSWSLARRWWRTCSTTPAVLQWLEERWDPGQGKPLYLSPACSSGTTTLRGDFNTTQISGGNKMF